MEPVPSFTTFFPHFIRLQLNKSPFMAEAKRIAELKLDALGLFFRRSDFVDHFLARLPRKMYMELHNAIRSPFDSPS